MKAKFLQQAFEELNDAVEYYEGEQSGLGIRMLNEVKKHVRWIRENPALPQIRKGGYRRVNLKIFPYYIAYVMCQDTLWLVAIAHNHRKPEYWINRKKQIG